MQKVASHAPEHTRFFKTIYAITSFTHSVNQHPGQTNNTIERTKKKTDLQQFLKKT